MSSVFADSGYWIAVLNPGDGLHAKATSESKKLEKARMVTTDFVLIEVLAFFAGRRASLREAAVKLVEGINSNPNVDVEPARRALFLEALEMYKKRTDKSWSLVDCSSFCVMTSRSITQALTHDKHFEQAGFVALLR